MGNVSNSDIFKFHIGKKLFILLFISDRYMAIYLFKVYPSFNEGIMEVKIVKKSSSIKRYSFFSALYILF